MSRARSEETIYSAEEVADIGRNKRSIASYRERLLEVAETSAAAAELRKRAELAEAEIRALKVKAEVFKAERIRALEEVLHSKTRAEREAIAEARVDFARRCAELRTRAAEAAKEVAADYLSKTDEWTAEVTAKMDAAKGQKSGVAAMLSGVGGLFRQSP